MWLTFGYTFLLCVMFLVFIFIFFLCTGLVFVVVVLVVAVVVVVVVVVVASSFFKKSMIFWILRAPLCVKIFFTLASLKFYDYFLVVFNVTRILGADDGGGGVGVPIVSLQKPLYLLGCPFI